MPMPRLDGDEKATHFTATVTREWLERLTRYAARVGLSKSAAIRKLLDEAEPPRKPRKGR